MTAPDGTTADGTTADGTAANGTTTDGATTDRYDPAIVSRGTPTAQVTVRRHEAGGPAGAAPDAEGDVVPTEEPLELRVEHDGRNEAIAVTMRTPGQDLQLGAGFLFTEGILQRREDLIEIKRCPTRGPDGAVVDNVVQAFVDPAARIDLDAHRRNVYTTSSCGVCGKASLDALAVHAAPMPPGPVFTAQVLHAMPAALRATQDVFADTGGLHATALFDPAGQVVVRAEDVGRHNATDKAVGRLFLQGRLPAHGLGMVVSGRASFEILQKAARAGVPLVAALGAPSSLAVDAAQAFGITLVGFLSAERFNVYTHPERVA